MSKMFEVLGPASTVLLLMYAAVPLLSFRGKRYTDMGLSFGLTPERELPPEFPIQDLLATGTQFSATNILSGVIGSDAFLVFDLRFQPGAFVDSRTARFMPDQRKTIIARRRARVSSLELPDDLRFQVVQNWAVIWTARLLSKPNRILSVARVDQVIRILQEAT